MATPQFRVQELDTGTGDKKYNMLETWWMNGKEKSFVARQFYAVYGNGPRAFELNRPNFISVCQRFVEKYQELEKLGDTDEDRLFEETGKALLAEGIILRKKGISGQAQQHSSQATEGIDPILQMKLKDMLKEMQEEQHPVVNPSESSEYHQKTPAAE
ncbi:28S ribosomal protein S23, mitochondrial [Protopterus annectens]|uniref:28S ribosomal protein S23, mitochondrial n=1 Tax=Protopterus annectens TaxID=7888 RepID=UPI001CFB2648|nr:28S ribosomal protein S23, mitochondrial [Protopterus annectens]